MRIALWVAYDGTNYSGWQKQKNSYTIQQILEEKLFSATGENIKVTGSGRTDAGVHAENQVCHFDTEKTNIPPEKYKFCLNNLLPNDIRILKSQKTNYDFHARYSAKKKTYEYNMYVSDVVLPLKDRYSLRIDFADIEKMRESSELFLGTHDFAAFSSAGSSVKDTVRTIYSLEVVSNANDVKIVVCGNGFLYNMVRILAGTLLSAAQGKINEEEIRQAFEKKDRKKAGKTLAARGLVLKSVEYV